MCDLNDYTLAQIQAMTKNAIIQAWAQGRTYNEITNREFDAAGQLIVLKWKTHSVLPDDVLSQTKIKWIFHANGTIHKITHFDYDAAGTLLNRYTIFHDAEGKTSPYRVEEGQIPEEEGLRMMSLDIGGQPLVEYVYTEDKSIIPTVTVLGAEIPLMSKTLWKFLGK